MEARDIRPISAAETHLLRHTILRPHQPLEAMVYTNDDDPLTLHAGAFHGGRLVGIASVAPSACPRFPFAEPWQLRGMATAPEVRGMGYGRGLIELCLAHIAAHGGRTLWCNGRTSAGGFYQAIGFAQVGAEFVTETGPHYIYHRGVPAQA